MSFKWLAGALGAVGGASPLSASSGASVGYSPVRPGRAIAAHALTGPSAVVAPFVLLALCLLAVPASAQLQGTCTLTSSGNYFVIRVNGDSIARHDTEVTMAARVLSEHLKRPGAAVTATRVQTVRPGGCLVAPGRVDTLSIVRVDTLYRRDTITVVRTDTLRLRDTVFVPVVTPPPPPPVDTVIVTPPPPPVDTVVVPPPVQSARLLVTPERLATWQRMIAEGHPLATMADANCKANRYGDTGLWCAWWYMATGDTIAGRKAVGTWLSTTSGTARNTVREEFAEKAVTMDWLCGAGVATPSECATMRAKLDPWKTLCQTARTDDGDLSIGCYFGRLAYAFATGDPTDLVAAGGLDRTGLNRSTARNTIGGYFDGMDGGALGESFEYDHGTSMLAVLGVEVAKSATGTDHFPEFPMADLARYSIASTTGDLKQWVQHWDDEHPRDQTARLFRRMTLYGSVQGITKDPSLHSLIRDLVTRYGWTASGQMDPTARMLLFIDPYAPVGTPLFGNWVANGHGMIYSRQPTQTLWLAAFNNTREDHEYNHLFDAQVYKDGEWVLTHPIGYAGEAWKVTASNGLSLAGFGSMYSRRMTWADSGNGWIAVSGMTDGSAYWPGYYNAPPSFVRYAGRTAVAGNVGTTTFVITRDTVDMDDPRTLARWDRYYKAGSTYPHQVWVNDANGLPWTIWHSPVAPVTNGNVLTWTTARGQPVRVELLADQPIQTATFDESVLWPNTTGSIFPSEKGWQVRANTPARVLWSVVQIGPPLPVTRVGDTVTVGSRTITITTAGVVVNTIP